MHCVGLQLVLLKEIIVIIKTQINLILNMYNLLSKFYHREIERERERACDGSAYTYILHIFI